MTDAPYEWITDPAALAAQFVQAPARIGLDTEFIRERTYWPQLALVQIAVRDAILLVDPLSPGMAEALRDVLEDARILKVMHSASEDLVAFGHACNALPAPLFDTQVAAALAGVGAGIGYQRLVMDLLEVHLEKGETRSDWLRRPLSTAQLAYAADDVRHLFALHDVLDARLAAVERQPWFIEDCTRMVDNARGDGLERWPHLSSRASQYLDPSARLRLLRVLRWRDAYARDHDRPRTWILDNELAAQIARDPPTDMASLQRQFDTHPKAPRRLAGEVWAALCTPLVDEHEAPPARTDERDKRAVRRLQDAVAGRSAELGLPDGVLASRRWLEALLDGDDWPGPLAGWRRRELEPLLAPLLVAVRPPRLPSADPAV
ncbi:MAG TPA: ribonuclease D [Luteimonas sp.]|nr:ribonuclease D [Luteimonas sp.]